MPADEALATFYELSALSSIRVSYLAPFAKYDHYPKQNNPIGLGR